MTTRYIADLDAGKIELTSERQDLEKEIEDIQCLCCLHCLTTVASSIGTRSLSSGATNRSFWVFQVRSICLPRGGGRGVLFAWSIKFWACHDEKACSE